MPTETDICNLSLLKLGGAGDTASDTALIADINGTDKVSTSCKLLFPRVRRSTIIDLAASKAPFRETIRFADLGAELASDSIPEIGVYKYAFNLPGNCLIPITQFDEGSIAIRFQPSGYMPPESGINFQFETVAGKTGAGRILLTDTLSNVARTSAFISMAIDITRTTAFSEAMIECIATLLASRVASVAGRDMEAAAFLLEQYWRLAVPNAKKANQASLNNSERPVSGYSGGRTSTLRSIT